MHYTVCINLPGCLPEAEPTSYGNLYEAQYVLLEEIDSRREDALAINDEDAATAWHHLWHEVAAITGDYDLPFSVTGPDNYTHNITLEYT